MPASVVSRDGLGIIDAAISGAGVVRLSDIAVLPLVRTGTLRQVLSEWTCERKAISVVMPPRDRPAAAKVRVYLDHLAALLERTLAAPR